MSAITSVRHGRVSKSATNATLSSYVDTAFGLDVHLVDMSPPEFSGHVGALIDDTTDCDGLFVCISESLPVERRSAVVRALVVSWVRQFDAAHAEGRTVVSAVSA